jgi:ParB family transcriptional regulator, chromosome partitioning protein
MAKKKPSILEKADDIFKEDEEELSGELFDVNAGKGMVRIKINRLIPNPDQPRKTFFEQTISELAESIKEHGVLSPIIVRPQGKKYEIIAGERRFKASKEAGLKEIPAIIKNVSNGDARVISLIENIQREDLNDIDRAAALRDLKVNLGSPWEEVAKRLSLTKRRVLDLVGLLDLPEEVKEEIRHKRLTEKHGRALRQLLKQADVLRDVFNFFKENKLTGDESIELVKAVKGEPRFTIEETHNKLKLLPKKEKIKKEPIELVVEESKRLVKILEKLEEVKFSKKSAESLSISLLYVQKKIKESLKFLGNISK